MNPTLIASEMQDEPAPAKAPEIVTVGQCVRCGNAGRVFSDGRCADCWRASWRAFFARVRRRE